MRTLNFNEIKIVNGAENNAMRIDVSLNSITAWAGLGACAFPLIVFSQTTSFGMLLSLAPQYPLAATIFATMGLGFTLGGLFGAGLYYYTSTSSVSNIETQS